MKCLRLLLSAAIVAAFSASLFAQQPSTGYHSVACLKVKPEKNAEFRKWAAEDAHKLAQSRVDSGAVSTWLLLRSIMPQGHSAECDYIAVTMYPGTPAQPMGMEELGAAIKKANLTMSAQDYVDKRNSLTTLISNNLYQNQASVGGMKKGDYFMVNEMKVHNMEEYLAYEKKVWKPLAEEMAKDGVRSGWSLNTQVLPSGSDLVYDAVTVDVYSTWDSIFKDDTKFAERFKKTHADMELGTTFEQYEKLRTMVSTKLYALEDLVSAAK